MKPVPYALLVGAALAMIPVGVNDDDTKGEAGTHRPKEPVGAALLAKWSTALKRVDPHQRASTLYEIAQFGPKANAAVPLAKGLLKSDPTAAVREMAAFALGEMGPRAKDAGPDLINALSEDPAPSVRGSAARALGHLAAEAVTAVPALIRALDDKTAYLHGDGPFYDPSCVCNDAAKALGRLKASDAVPALAGQLSDSRPHVSRAAAKALGGIGPEAKAAVPALIKALKNPNQWACQSAIEAIGRIGPAAAEAVPTLIELLEHANEHNRISTATALGRIGPAAEQAIPMLLAGMDDATPQSA